LIEIWRGFPGLLELYLCLKFSFLQQFLFMYGTVLTGNWQAMDALTEEKAEERAAYQEQLAQLEAAQAAALHQAAHAQDQAIRDIRRQHEDEKRQLRQQFELEHELEFDAFKQKYTSGELKKVKGILYLRINIL
jgi:hypothetical protein